ncbi:LexA family protein [Kiritimatiella glycovorans]|uniref:LexA repressor n=1 Tax=Kiritimatiella glycovorans TaxID=1307763 RepID=A0A0G3EL91_9BACT|nr:S24 family peptidase [Kiritimatiella glycovorans]AKJ64899.1 LexA repressor [Kiritimatiella glycovorans]
MDERTVKLHHKIQLLREFCREERRMPTYAEMLALFRYRSKNAVYRLVEKLAGLGYVERDRAGKLVPTPRLTGSLKLLGAVQAGFPSPAEEELVDVISLDEFLVADPKCTFMLTVQGDSMIDAGIQPGDLVLVEKGREPKKNDVVIAQVDGEWTLKYYGRDRKGVYLDPANRNYHRIRPEQSFEIGGVVRAAVRRYR